jgi:hypothetical protein
VSTPPPPHTHTLQHPSHAMFVVTNKHDTRVICIHAQHAHKQIQMDLPGRDDGSTDSARVRVSWISGLHRSWRRGACSLGEVSGKVGVLVDRQGTLLTPACALAARSLSMPPPPSPSPPLSPSPSLALSGNGEPREASVTVGSTGLADLDLTSPPTDGGCCDSPSSSSLSDGTMRVTSPADAVPVFGPPCFFLRATSGFFLRATSGGGGGTFSGYSPSFNGHFFVLDDFPIFFCIEYTVKLVHV